ncbi:hypothetical protein QBC37DRAFT_478719 [Rhypophila decipiens]|uniref:Uncharacterized protein n=1 Tax=Rhypophila decipiens TaxID=261697 RepID=A0AAN7BCC7_9PEZI|nr:hypothetical protein QBC37DRAFT_478719 [Rhypophila decipiens]
MFKTSKNWKRTVELPQTSCASGYYLLANYLQLGWATMNDAKLQEVQSYRPLRKGAIVVNSHWLLCRGFHVRAIFSDLPHCRDVRRPGPEIALQSYFERKGRGVYRGLKGPTSAKGLPHIEYHSISIEATTRHEYDARGPLYPPFSMHGAECLSDSQPLLIQTSASHTSAQPFFWASSESTPYLPSSGFGSVLIADASKKHGS